jgi:hypothetical protein
MGGDLTTLVGFFGAGLMTGIAAWAFDLATNHYRKD